MKVHQPYKCDYCPELKGNANHWFLRNIETSGFYLLRWNPELADDGEHEHICSEQCAIKALNKWASSNFLAVGASLAGRESSEG
jgi:hypothetical protein